MVLTVISVALYYTNLFGIQEKSAWLTYGIWTLVLGYSVSIVICAGILILEKGNPSKSLAWIMMLILLPGLGLILYSFLGAHFKEESKTSKGNPEFLKLVKSYRKKRIEPAGLQELDLEEINEASLDQPIFVGGPVPGQLIAVHDLPDCSETEVMTGLYVATQRATLMRLFLSDARMRLFSGYAGWGEGQLEDELRMGGWLTCPASVDSVLGDPSSLWDEVVRKIGQDILGLDNSAPLPDDPSMN